MLIFCSGGILIMILWKSVQLNLEKSSLHFLLMQLELNFFLTSYFSVRAKTPLNARVYVVSNFQNNFRLKLFFTENHDFWSFLVIFGKNCKKVFFPNSFIYRSHRLFGSFEDLQNLPFSGSPILISMHRPPEQKMSNR